MVERAQKDAFLDAGRAAVGLVADVVHLTCGGGLGAAAGPLAVLVAQDHRGADPGRDGVGVADVERQARPRQPGTELLPAQEAGQAAGPGDQVHGFADDLPLEHLPGVRGQRRRIAAAFVPGLTLRVLADAVRVPGLTLARRVLPGAVAGPAVPGQRHAQLD